jgi:hypothetical protein
LTSEALGTARQTLFGAVASYAFKAHNVLAALYHGATAPLALAFLTGIDTHAR